MRRILRLVSAASLVLAGTAMGVTGLDPVPPTPAYAQDNGLARTPPMGFNDWNSFGCNVDEQLIKSTADLFVSTGLKDAGYTYVNIDDCWLTHERDAGGHLVPDPVKFPDGISGTADYVHSKGLKLGIYEDAGTETCAGYPGSLGHEKIDAQDFADWGVDYLKYDNCNNAGQTSHDQYVARYTAMRDALTATGRPIVYSICEWGSSEPWTWAGDVGNLWRTTGDINDSWASLKKIIRLNLPLSRYAGPGHWNDPDMLEVGNGGMTDTEYRTHFGLWAMMAAPLLIGSDLRKATPATMDILLNRDVIALDQDPLGKQAGIVSDSGGHVVFARPLAGGDVAVALYNETDSPATIGTTASAVGIGSAPAYTLRDVWSHDTTETAGAISASVPAHGTAVYRVAKAPDWARYAPTTALSLDVPPVYQGGPVSVVRPGVANPLTTSLTDDGRAPVTAASVSLTGPDGWRLEHDSATSAPSLPTGRTLRTRWTVRPPADAAPGVYPLAVTSRYRWGSRHRAASTTTADVLITVPPRAGDTYLSDLDWISASNGWGPPEKDMSNGEKSAGDGHTLTINGTTYDKGLGVHAPSEILYYLGGRCSAVRTDVGVDDEKTSNSNVTFRIYADGVEVADSGPMTFADDAKRLTADVADAQLVRLVVDSNGSTDSDHGDWAGIQMVCG
ncbi:MAG: NPCBM/NEW2 domain-containing protein [Actinocatenispora sp.]